MIPGGSHEPFRIIVETRCSAGDPVVVPFGATMTDAAYHLHKDIAQNLQFARLWNNSGYDGQRVERGHVLADKDILEFHV